MLGCMATLQCSQLDDVYIVYSEVMLLTLCTLRCHTALTMQTSSTESSMTCYVNIIKLAALYTADLHVRHHHQNTVKLSGLQVSM